MKLGRLIKTLRVGLGYSQADLADRLDISTSYLCLLETEKRIPSNELLGKVGEILSVSHEALIFLTTSVPSELTKDKASKYQKLQENIAALLLFQGNREIA